MRILSPALLLLPALSWAQLNDVDMSQFKFKSSSSQKTDAGEPGQHYRFRNKALKLVKDDPEFQELDAAKQEIVLRTVALKIANYKKYNREHNRSKYKVRKMKVNVAQIEEDEDLQTVLKRYPKLRKMMERDQKRIAAEEKRGGFRGREIIDMNETAGTPGVTPPQPEPQFVDVKPDQPFLNLFPDNEWVVEGCDAAALEALVDKAVAQAGPKGYVTRITIASSASTLRNTGQAENLTFLQLSENRAKAARDFVIEELQAQGKEFNPEDADLTWTGTNGDGTSGPRPPDGIPGGPGGGAPPADVTKENYLEPYAGTYEGDDYSKRNPPVSFYSPFKYVTVEIQVGKPVEPEQVEPTPGTPPNADVVYLEVSAPRKKRWLWFPEKVHVSDDVEPQEWSLCKPSRRQQRKMNKWLNNR